MNDPDEPIYINVEFEYYECADFRAFKILDFLEEALDG